MKSIVTHVFKHIAKHIALMCAVFIVACQWGTRPQNLRPAIGPEGAIVAIRVSGESTDRTGELFAADSTGLIMERWLVWKGRAVSKTGGLLHVRWSRIAAMDVDQLGGMYDLASGATMSPDRLARLTLVSRFPQGLNSQLLREVLRARGQAALEELP